MRRRWFWECLEAGCAACGRRGHKQVQGSPQAAKNAARDAARRHIIDKHGGAGAVLLYEAVFCQADERHYRTEIRWAEATQ